MSDNDVDAILAAARALPPPRPTTKQQQQQRRRLDDAVAAEAMSRRRRLSPVGIAAALVLAATGAAAAIGVGIAVTRPVLPVAPPVVSTVDVVDRPAPPGLVPVTSAPAATITTPTTTSPTTTKKATTKTTTKTAPAAFDVATAIAGVIDGDAHGASADLSRALRADFVEVDARLARALEQADLDDDAAGRLRRLRCENALRYRRDVAAVDVCRAYSQHHPDDVAARPLAFGAGGLAEDLGRLNDAIDLYTRCIVMAPLHGQSSADALKARARVHAAAGHADDAAADLRLFLRLRPGAGFDDDVRALARELGVR